MTAAGEGPRHTPLWPRAGWVAAVLALLAGGCGIAPAVGGDLAEPAFGAELPASETLDRVAQERAEEMCDARRVIEQDRPRGRYTQETWTEVVELVGRAPLDAVTSAGRARARSAAEDGWSGRDELGSDWDARGSGEAVCEDDNLYVATALARRPDPEDVDATSRPRHTNDELRTTMGVAFRRGDGDRSDRRSSDVALDLFAPPTTADTRHPALLLVHGGGFVGGSRVQHRAEARAWARRGFVAVAIDYRLDPDDDRDRRATRAAARRALDDARDAVRWVRAHADAWDIDPERIAVLGASAGGQLALGLALLDDPGGTGPFGVESSAVAAAFSTGAFLDPVLGLTDLRTDTAPVLLHHFESDTVSGRAWSSAGSTCDAIRDVGGTCDLSVSAGADHIVGLGPLGPLAGEVLAFLTVHLGLDG